MERDRIRQALQYIDEHLDQPLTYEMVAQHMHFSAYYFHRLFSAVVGRSIAAHVRERRLMKACRMLAAPGGTVLDICLACGFSSPQAFARAFKAAHGCSPGAYRRKGGAPPVMPEVDEMVRRFTNRLEGGVLVHPRLIRRGRLFVAGVTGDGGKTGEVWETFMRLQQSIGLPNRLSDNGYEVRVYDDGVNHCDCHVGLCVRGRRVDPAFSVMELPASEYAAFDVYVSQGYDSENGAMNRWLKDNEQGYAERLLDGRHYAVEFYDERFHGEEDGSIVEIWIPVEKTAAG